MVVWGRAPEPGGAPPYWHRRQLRAAADHVDLREVAREHWSTAEPARLAPAPPD